MHSKSKKPNVAEVLLKDVRMLYPSLYSSNFEFIMDRVAGDGGYFWKDGVLVESNYGQDKQERGLTEDGWEHFKNVSEVPTHWNEPDKKGPLFNIPENIHADWIEELSLFLYQLKKIDAKILQDYITAHYKLQNWTHLHTTDSINKNMTAFKNLVSMVEECKVKDRLDRIQIERYQVKLPPKPRMLKVGDEVRAKHFEKISKVKRIFSVNTSEYAIETVELESDIDGSVFWEKSLLKFA